VPNEAPSAAVFVQTMLLTATTAPAQYEALMNQSGIIASVGLHGKAVHDVLHLFALLSVRRQGRKDKTRQRQEGVCGV